MKFSQLKKYSRLRRNVEKLEQHSADVVHTHEVPLEWIHKRLSRNQFLILSGILVGTTAGLGGVLLKAIVHYIEEIITKDNHLPFQLLVYLIFPIIGIILTVAVVKFLLRGNDEKGIPKVLYEIAQKSSLISSTRMYSQIITSAITVALGGSAGLESPIAVTGAAIGSNYAKTYHLNYKERTLLLAAGAAAGIASAFNAPIAGVMFSVELLLSGVAFSDFIPLIIASVCGSLVSKIILSEGIILHFSLRQPFDYYYVPYYILLGLFCGLYSRYYSIVAEWLEDKFHEMKVGAFQKAAIGGVILSILCFLFPPLFGEGYTSIKTLADGQAQMMVHNSLFSNYIHNGWMIVMFVGLVCLLKVFATTITIASGGNGGNFAPSLVAGAFLGYFFATLFGLLHIETLPVTNFAIVAMAGVMAGVLYAPLTSIFLIAEATGGYDLFIPLMIVSTSAFLISKRFSSYSIDVKKLVKEGKIFTREHDKNLLTMLHTNDIIEKDIRTISPDAKLGDLVNLIKSSRRNLFGVVNENDELAGIIVLDDVKDVMFNSTLYETTFIKQIMKNPPSFIDVNEDMKDVMKKFDETQAWNLPVVNGKRFLGFISKSSLLNNYRQLLIEHSTL